ncbi:thioredoxin [Thiohalophilus sp.]|uniref:thioredoxin n=1 Tax=Thiohalophilus sp. TaxID=3028392 RepID=UPI003A0FE671
MQFQEKSMASVELTPENFKDVIEQNDFVIIDFWAPWCGPCQSFGPVYEEVSEKHDDIVFAKVNTEDQQEMAGMFNIRSIPTLMIFREQVILYSEAGALQQSAFEKLIEDAKALDMEKVHQEVAKQQQEQEQQAQS